MTSRRFRPVEDYVVRGGCEPLVHRIDDVVPADAEIVVLDLDRTVHFGVTIGEQLGWEALGGAAAVVGDGVLEPFFSWRRPARSARNLGVGLRRWGLAGAIYATAVKLGDQWDGWRRFLALRHGAHYVERVQTMLRHVLMANLADFDRDQVAAYCENAWRRWEKRLVVTAETVAELRRRRPRVRAVLLSSASTTPTVAHAAAALGADGYVSSEVDVYAAAGREIYSAPAGVPAWFRRGRPTYFSRPGAVVHNAADNKISLLRERYPDVFSRGVVAVGVTDNNYGEDRTWTEHFTHVVALNSRHPFSPFVSESSPCRSIVAIDAVPAAAGHGAQRYEWLGTLNERRMNARAIMEQFGDHDLRMLESLFADLRVARARVAEALDVSWRSRVASLVARTGEAVDRYNNAAPAARKTLARELDRIAREARRLERRMLGAGRFAAAVEHDMDAIQRRMARSIAVR